MVKLKNGKKLLKMITPEEGRKKKIKKLHPLKKCSKEGGLVPIDIFSAAKWHLMANLPLPFPPQWSY